MNTLNVKLTNNLLSNLLNCYQDRKNGVILKEDFKVVASMVDVGFDVVYFMNFSTEEYEKYLEKYSQLFAEELKKVKPVLLRANFDKEVEKIIKRIMDNEDFPRDFVCISIVNEIKNFGEFLKRIFNSKQKMFITVPVQVDSYGAVLSKGNFENYTPEEIKQMHKELAILMNLMGGKADEKLPCLKNEHYFTNLLSEHLEQLLALIEENIKREKIKRTFVNIPPSLLN